MLSPKSPISLMIFCIYLSRFMVIASQIDISSNQTQGLRKPYAHPTKSSLKLSTERTNFTNTEIHSCEDIFEDPRNKTEESNERLEEYIARLRSIILVAILKNPGIQWSNGKLTKDLNSLGSFIGSIEPQDKDLRKTLAFAQRMYMMLVNSSQMLAFYQFNDESAQLLICKMIQMNARLWLFLDSRGSPNYRLKNFESDIALLSRTLKSWEALISNMHEKPESLQLVLRRQFAHARQNLQILESFIPVKRIV